MEHVFHAVGEAAGEGTKEAEGGGVAEEAGAAPVFNCWQSNN